MPSSDTGSKRLLLGVGLCALLAAAGCRKSSEPIEEDSGTAGEDAAVIGPELGGLIDLNPTSEARAGRESGVLPAVDTGLTPGPMKVAAVQYGPGLFKHAPGCSDDNCAVAYYVTEAAKQGATYIATPEGALDQGGYAELCPKIGDKPATTWAQTSVIRKMAELAAQLKVMIIFNVATQVGSGPTAKLYNTNIAVDRTGTVVQLHHKYHLYSGESDTYTAGTSCVDSFATPAGQAGILICADVNCVIYLVHGVSASSCLAIDKKCMPAYQAAGLKLTFISSFWMATGSSNKYWKATTTWSILAKYSKTYVVASNIIAGSSLQYHGGGIYRPDGTEINIYDQQVPGIAIGVIP